MMRPDLTCTHVDSKGRLGYNFEPELGLLGRCRLCGAKVAPGALDLIYAYLSFRTIRWSKHALDVMRELGAKTMACSIYYNEHTPLNPYEVPKAISKSVYFEYAKLLHKGEEYCE